MTNRPLILKWNRTLKVRRFSYKISLIFLFSLVLWNSCQKDENSREHLYFFYDFHKLLAGERTKKKPWTRVEDSKCKNCCAREGEGEGGGGRNGCRLGEGTVSPTPSIPLILPSHRSPTFLFNLSLTGGLYSRTSREPVYRVSWSHDYVQMPKYISQYYVLFFC